MEHQIKKNYSEWTEEEKEAFVKRKEIEYQIRRDRVSEYCDGQSSNFSRKVYTLIHDNVDNVRDGKEIFQINLRTIYFIQGFIYRSQTLPLILPNDNNSQGKFKIAIFSNFISIIHKPLISSIILLSIII